MCYCHSVFFSLEEKRQKSKQCHWYINMSVGTYFRNLWYLDAWYIVYRAFKELNLETLRGQEPCCLWDRPCFLWPHSSTGPHTNTHMLRKGSLTQAHKTHYIARPAHKRTYWVFERVHAYCDGYSCQRELGLGGGRRGLENAEERNTWTRRYKECRGGRVWELWSSLPTEIVKIDSESQTQEWKGQNQAS